MARGATKGGVVPLALFDSLGDGVTIADENGRIVYSNKAADRILGIGATDAAPDEWAGHYGVFVPDGSAPFPTAQYPLVRALHGEETNDVQMLIRNVNVPQGALISATGRPLRGDGGRIEGASVVFREVAQRRTKAPVAALRDELLALRNAVDERALVERIEAALQLCDQLDR